MRIENILNFFETAEKADIILTVAIVIIILALIYEIIATRIKLRQIYKMQKKEFDIIAMEFARIAPNHFVTNYSADSDNDNKDDNKMKSV